LFEHGGISNHVTYFQTINYFLQPGGLYLHHAIHRPAKRDRKRFRGRSREYTALIRYIFPGGELDHLGMSVDNLHRHGFEVHDVEGWREHYARTCRLWHDRLLAHQAEAAQEAGALRARLWIRISPVVPWRSSATPLEFYQPSPPNVFVGHQDCHQRGRIFTATDATKQET
jgi:cyclopropane-fatty-acyl-phospholipid synthase